MKLQIIPEIKLSAQINDNVDLYVHDNYIGTFHQGEVFPLHSLIFQCLEDLCRGVVAVSRSNSKAFVIDVGEFVDKYLMSGGILEYLQSLTNAGKWELYSTYKGPEEGTLTAYFGLLFPLNLRNKSFSIVCNSAELINMFFYYDKNLGNSHWFMPKGCVIGVCATFKILEYHDYLTFDVVFDNEVGSSILSCFRTRVGFIDKSFFNNIPDINRIHRISGPRANEVSYVKGGLADFLALKSIISKYGICLDSASLRILDWGVGCGRVARRFVEHATKSVLYGIDIDRDNIDWCQKKLIGEFSTVPLSPPTSFESGFFDIIYSCSVLSHLTEKYIHLWLHEINRLLSPDGIALLSFNGSSNSSAYLSRRPGCIESLCKYNFFDADVNRQLQGFIDSNDYYRATFAVDEWWFDVLSTHFDLVSIELSVVSGHQHIAVLHKKK